MPWMAGNWLLPILEIFQYWYWNWAHILENNKFGTLAHVYETELLIHKPVADTGTFLAKLSAENLPEYFLVNQYR
jgi:hypothetical protein